MVNVGIESERFEFETRNSDEIAAQTASCYGYAYTIGHFTHRTMQQG